MWIEQLRRAGSLAEAGRVLFSAFNDGELLSDTDPARLDAQEAFRDATAAPNADDRESLFRGAFAAYHAALLAATNHGRWSGRGDHATEREAIAWVADQLSGR